MTMEMFPRLRAVTDLTVALSREYAGLHDYDGVVQDLSPDGVRQGLAKLGGPALDDPFDEAFSTCAERLLHVQYADLELYRRNALPHLMNLDLAVYDRAYAPEADRLDARRRHLRAWPDAIDAAIEALDRLPAPVAKGLMPAVKGLAAGLNAADAVEGPAVKAHARLVAHIEDAATNGNPDASLGGDGLATLLGAMEAIDINLSELTSIAESESQRLGELLRHACARYRPDVPVKELITELLRDHPDADGVIEASTVLTAEAIAWTNEHNLVPYNDGVCVVERSPDSRRWAMAMMAPAAPWETDAPSFFHVTPPHSEWPAEQQEEWLSIFSATTLPSIAIHEVAPGHFSHARALLRAPSAVRRTVFSESFLEGWAHYVEEVAVEEGFHDDDPRFAIGVYLEALVRVTRLVSAIGIHTGAMDVDESARRFREDAFLRGPAARLEAQRATFDPSYGRYTWGKLVINDLREQARKQWGDTFSLLRFHTAMLDLGSPPLGLIGAALEHG